MLALLPTVNASGCLSASSAAESLAVSAQETLVEPKSLANTTEYTALTERLCAAVERGHLTVISDYDRTLVSPDAQGVADDVGETIKQLLARRKVTSFNVVTMRGFGSPVVNEIAKFPVYLYAEGGLLLLPPPEANGERLVSQQTWFSTWLEDHATTWDRRSTADTNPNLWYIRVPDEDAFTMYRDQRDAPCAFMNQALGDFKRLFSDYYDQQISQAFDNAIQSTLLAEKDNVLSRIFFRTMS